MSYLFHHHQQFTLIDATPKSGVFCQFFMPNSSPKTLPIQHQYTTQFSAFLDEKNKPYIVAMPDIFHINYYTLNNTHFTRKPLISNTTENYELSSPHLYKIDHAPELIYLSHQTNSSDYHFVHHDLDTEQITILLTLPNKPSHIKLLCIQNTVYLFYILQGEFFSLNCLRLNGNQAEELIYIKSREPLIDYSICIQEGLVHGVLVTELHGKYQLSYFNSQRQSLLNISTSTLPPEPIIFYYYKALFINAIIDKKLRIFLSIDQGYSFSLPALSSLQTNLHRYFFTTTQKSHLIASELYASSGNSLKLCTLAMIDFDGFHADTLISNELELLLEGLLLTSVTPSNDLVEENKRLKNERDDLKQHLPTSETKSTRSSTVAKSAFMDELTGWDLPPLI